MDRLKTMNEQLLQDKTSLNSQLTEVLIWTIIKILNYLQNN